MKNIKEFMTAFKKAAKTTNTIWVEWVHRQTGKSHCDSCLKLDKCWFTEEKKPKLPQHFFCHCTTKPLDYSRVLNEATSDSAYSKFDPYLFDPENSYGHGKNKMFEDWGYSVKDSQWLKSTMEKQGLEKYVAGDYVLGKLNKRGQRISIRIHIPRKDREGMASFITGWMVYPNGHIQLNTPYGGE